MLLSELKWNIGGFWDEVAIGQHRLWRCRLNGGTHDNVTHSAGEYAASENWNGITGTRNYTNMDEITAQAILFHLLGGGDAAQ